MEPKKNNFFKAYTKVVIFQLIFKREILQQKYQNISRRNEGDSLENSTVSDTILDMVQQATAKNLGERKREKI